MIISLISTVKDEVKNVDKLMDSIANQSVMPNEIIIVDAGSKDGTLEKLNEWKLNLKNLIVIEKKGCNRSEGRNHAIEKSAGDVIAATDFGCVLSPKWIDELTSPIIRNGYDVTAGYYFNGDKSIFAEVNSYFTHPALFEIDINTFLPSTRSIAFKKECWKKIYGFNVNYIFGEDTLFSSSLRKNGFKVFFNKDAKVEWNSEKSFFGMIKKIFNYSRWDGVGGFSKRFYFKMGFIISAGIIMAVCSLINDVVLYFFLLLLLFYFLKTFLRARKKNIRFYPALLAAIIKPLYNFVQLLGFISGKTMRIK